MSTTETVEKWMADLEREGVIRFYDVAGKDYFECVNWDEHQELKYRKKTGIPAPSGAIPENSGKVQKVSHEEKRSREEVEGGSVPRTPSTPFCGKHPNGTDQACRACGDARRAHLAATKAEKDKPTPGPPRTADLCPEHPDLGYRRSQCPMH